MKTTRRYTFERPIYQYLQVDGARPGSKARFETGTETVTVEVEVDIDKICAIAAERAAQNKTNRGTFGTAVGRVVKRGNYRRTDPPRRAS